MPLPDDRCSRLSSRGDVESALELLQQVVVDQEFSPFYARRLTLKMGLSGALIQSVSAIVEDVPLVCSERLGSEWKSIRWVSVPPVN